MSKPTRRGRIEVRFTFPSTITGDRDLNFDRESIPVTRAAAWLRQVAGDIEAVITVEEQRDD